MDYNTLSAISSRIDELYSKCVRTAIEEAMTASCGDRAYAEFARIDAENTQKTNQKRKDEGKDPIPPITQSKKSFEEFDTQACSKTLFYLPKVRKQILDYFRVDSANGDVMQKLNKPLSALINERNKKKHIDGQIESQILKSAARNEILVVETLFPNRVDPADPQGQSYLRQMEAAYAGFLTEQANQRYAAADCIDPQTFDLSQFYAACMQLKIRAEMEEGESYFYSSDLEKDLARLKNILPKRDAKNAEPAPAAAWMPPPAAEAEPRPTPQAQPTVPVQSRAPAQTSVQDKPGRGKLPIILLGCLAAVLALVLIVVLATRPKNTGTQPSSGETVLPAQQTERRSEAPITEPEPSTTLPIAATSAPAPTTSATVPVQTTEAPTVEKWKSSVELDKTTYSGRNNVVFTIDQDADQKIVIHYTCYSGKLTLGWVSPPTVTLNYEDGRKVVDAYIYTAEGRIVQGMLNPNYPISPGSGEFYVMIDDIDGLVSLTIHNVNYDRDPSPADVTIPLNN